MVRHRSLRVRFNAMRWVFHRHRYGQWSELFKAAGDPWVMAQKHYCRTCGYAQVRLVCRPASCCQHLMKVRLWYHCSYCGTGRRGQDAEVA